MSLPNIITGFRILLIPVLVIAFYLLPMETRYIISAFIFTVASITDWLDGYLARKMGQMTAFGAFLDPVADKLIVAVALVLLVEVHASAVLAIPALVIVCREIVVSALREWMARYSDKRGVAVSFLAKVKTVFQMIAIIVLLASGPDPHALQVILGYILLYAAAGLTLLSMYQYLRLAWPDLSSGMKNKD
ncbi:MAG: CDP-diacylglycerol--glycerol-3-phosphate 3-phosphatidyltransferase [Pseudomonadota bacterium]|nr:CDP-diacylglycerol--glycerol-3-phosphate 3-phosphatidyltransferase [Pseudomonadota bacterium]MEC8819609.1 CDP-diacylglycerol--glycerol-3-phosphate 3-phosphatidyltransferase [Pseudomonadota bacterium]